MSNIEVTFVSHNCKPVCAPDPAYPDGRDIDLSSGAKVACVANLPYPAECCGILLVACKKCGYSAVVTTAGRVDDPRTVKVPCK